jgi:hypothetical protein
MNIEKRKVLSKRQRFEVFKRDSFTCQYCGQSSPDVILHVDHINPVAKGGTNSIINLVTSCNECNMGKSDKLLSDDSAVKKQLSQIKALQERKEQIQMISKWAETLLHDDEIKHIDKMLDRLISKQLSPIGIKKMRARIKKHGFKKIIESMPGAFDRYGVDFLDKFDTYLKYVGASEEDKHFMYSVGILRNKLSDIGELYRYDSKRNRQNLDELRSLGLTKEEYRKIVLRFNDADDYDYEISEYLYHMASQGGRK